MGGGKCTGESKCPPMPMPPAGYPGPVKPLGPTNPSWTIVDYLTHYIFYIIDDNHDMRHLMKDGFRGFNRDGTFWIYNADGSKKIVDGITWKITKKGTVEFSDGTEYMPEIQEGSKIIFLTWIKGHNTWEFHPW